MLLQGRNVRGSLPFIPSTLKLPFRPASLKSSALVARQAKLAFAATKTPTVRSSSLQVGQPVRARVGHKWLPGVVQVVCRELKSYFVRLSNGRSFRRTCWAINIKRSAGSLTDADRVVSFVPGSVSFGPAAAQQSRPLFQPSGFVDASPSFCPPVVALSKVDASQSNHPAHNVSPFSLGSSVNSPAVCSPSPTGSPRPSSSQHLRATIVPVRLFDNEPYGSSGVPSSQMLAVAAWPNSVD